MKSLLVTLTITLLLTISSYSQTTLPVAKTISLGGIQTEVVLISPAQLKLTNKIFAENNLLVMKNSYLHDEVSIMTDIYKQQSKEIGTLKNVILKQETIIANHVEIREEYEFQLKQARKKQRKTLFGSIGIGGLVLLGTILILK